MRRPIGVAYHHFKMNQEQTQKLKDAMERKKKMADLREATGSEDEELLGVLLDIGIDRDTMQVLHLVPLLEVAWADDEIQIGEEKLLRKLANMRGIEADSEAYQILDDWLQRKPSDKVFDACSQIVRVMISQLPAEEREDAHSDLEQRILAVAQAAGGLFGIGSVSGEEREIIEKLAKMFATD